MFETWQGLKKVGESVKAQREGRKIVVGRPQEVRKAANLDMAFHWGFAPFYILAVKSGG